ncbi:hypothetical protein QJQ45_022501, partial [Haematococcus lacustris]
MCCSSHTSPHCATRSCACCAGNDILALHNAYRAAHSAPALSWDSQLQSKAQSWANNLASNCQFYHSGSGENLASGFASWADAAYAWYVEYKQYNYNAPGYSAAVGHFTQMVWLGTTKLGCATANSRCSQGVIYVCQYDPPGNVNAPQYFRDNHELRAIHSLLLPAQADKSLAGRQLLQQFGVDLSQLNSLIDKAQKAAQSQAQSWSWPQWQSQPSSQPASQPQSQSPSSGFQLPQLPALAGQQQLLQQTFKFSPMNNWQPASSPTQQAPSQSSPQASPARAPSGTGCAAGKQNALMCCSSHTSPHCATRSCACCAGNDILALHNAYRAAHSAPALSWDSQLQSKAQSWANNLASNCQFYHSGSGENLASGFASWADAAYAWYVEYKQYNYNAPGYSAAVGHFTQMVWLGTTKLGCATANSRCSQGVIYVCQYDPPGNVNAPQYFRDNAMLKAAVLQFVAKTWFSRLTGLDACPQMHTSMSGASDMGPSGSGTGLAGRQLLQQFGVDLSQLNSLIDKAQKAAQSQAQSWSWPQWQSQPSSQPASQPQSQSPSSGFQLPQLPALAGQQQLLQQTFKFSPMNNWQPASSPTQQAPSQSSPQASPARAPSGTGCAAGKQNALMCCSSHTSPHCATRSCACCAGNDILALHNAYRAAHSAPALSWDSQLQSKAQSWANNLASNCQFYHSGSGENLASGFASWADAAYAWYVEYKQYNYNAPGYSAAVGHFTQMVWLGTTKLGCATADSRCSQGVIYVCQYDPPGNVNAPQYFRDNHELRAIHSLLLPAQADKSLAGRQLLQQFGVDLSQLNSLIDKAQKAAQSQAQSWSWPQWQSQPSSQPASQPQSQSPSSGFQLPQLPALAGQQQLLQQTFKFSPMNNWQPASSPTQQAPSQSSPQASPARAPSGTGCAAGKQNALMCCSSHTSPHCATRSCACCAGNDILALHNAYRAAHSAPALSWDSQLQSKAQSWANNLASNCQFYHSGSGENLASGFASWADAAYAWYVEYKQYNYNAPGYSAAVGHFTQMVWLGTTKLGCATANSRCSQGVIYVCQYDPPGNVNAPQYFRDNHELRAIHSLLLPAQADKSLAGRQLLQQFGVDLSQLNSLIDKAQKAAQSQAQSWSWPQWQSQPSSQPASQPQSQSPSSGFQLPQLPALAGQQQLLQQTFKFSPMNNWQPASSPTQQAPSQSSPQASPARAPSGTGCAAGKQNALMCCSSHTSPHCATRSCACCAGNDILALHNAYRAAHSAPALSWDSQLQSKAQSWANNLASNCQFYHSGSGENLASGFASWADAAYAWYVEYKQYNYNAPGYSAAVGHFTQMVWLGTTKLGCATADSRCSQGVIYVCQYDPPGNVNAPQYFRDNAMLKAAVLQFVAKTWFSRLTGLDACPQMHTSMSGASDMGPSGSGTGLAGRQLLQQFGVDLSQLNSLIDKAQKAAQSQAQSWSWPQWQSQPSSQPASQPQSQSPSSGFQLPQLPALAGQQQLLQQTFKFSPMNNWQPASSPTQQAPSQSSPQASPARAPSGTGCAAGKQNALMCCSSHTSPHCATRSCACCAGNDILALHNAYRAAHSAPALSWDSQLQSKAQSWANNLASNCQFYHSGSGENLASGFASWADAAYAWYVEYKQYNYNAPGYSAAVGHFTQMVWLGTTKLGCATADSRCSQ